MAREMWLAWRLGILSCVPVERDKYGCGNREGVTRGEHLYYRASLFLEVGREVMCGKRAWKCVR